MHHYQHRRRRRRRHHATHFSDCWLLLRLLLLHSKVLGSFGSVLYTPAFISPPLKKHTLVGHWMQWLAHSFNVLQLIRSSNWSIISCKFSNPSSHPTLRMSNVCMPFTLICGGTSTVDIYSTGYICRFIPPPPTQLGNFLLMLQSSGSKWGFDGFSA